MSAKDALKTVDELDSESSAELSLQFSDLYISDNGDANDGEDESKDYGSRDSNS